MNELTLVVGNQEGTALCTMQAETMEEKALLFNLSSNPEYKLSDFINKSINVKDVFAEVVEMVSEKTGEVEECPRIVLIDTDNKGYSCVSKGIYNSIRRLALTFGNPTWEKGIPLIVQQKKIKENSVLILNVDTDTMKKRK